MRLADALTAILASHRQSGAATMYVGSLPINDYLPGFTAQNVLPVLGAHVAPRIWLGHASNVSAHFDTYDNVACVVAGTRRFTLYPPEVIAALYVGPIDNTMAGQPVSLAASAPEDDAKYPLFGKVRDQALFAELEPGDAHLPSQAVVASGRVHGLIQRLWSTTGGTPLRAARMRPTPRCCSA